MSTLAAACSLSPGAALRWRGAADVKRWLNTKTGKERHVKGLPSLVEVGTKGQYDDIRSKEVASSEGCK